VTGRAQPHVVMLAGNDIEVDARVRKYLRSAVEAGLEVTVVGLSRSAQREELDIEGARAIRVPVPGSSPSRVSRKVRAIRRRLPARTAAHKRTVADYLAQPAQARWRQVLPELQAYEAAVGPLLDELDADLLHPHDIFMLGVAVRAAARSQSRGHRAFVVYDSHEYLPGLAGPPARTTAAYVDHEREYLPRADRVITVSEPIADELARSYGLDRRPSLVLNAPIVAPVVAGQPSARAAADLPDDVPIVLYGGGLARARGVHTVVEALALLPEVHLVVVSRAPSHYTRELQALAAELGCADRYHEVGFVEPDQVVAYFASATVGIVPLLHSGNHDWALTNKFLEYIQAGLPIVTSDTEVQERLVDELGIGRVFVAGDAADCANAVRAVLADLDRYRAPLRDPELLRRMSWPVQADVFLGLYRELLGALPSDGASETVGDGTLDAPHPPSRPGSPQ